jgi:TPR repeat protein
MHKTRLRDFISYDTKITCGSASLLRRIAVYILLAFIIAGTVLGYSYYSASHPKPSIPLAEKPVQQALDLAAQGNSEAQYLTGWRYQFGDDGLPVDYENAAEWYRQAAEQGHTGAQNQLGNLYSEGLGIEKDPLRALQWYRKAADQGHMTSMANIGNAYYEGNGVTQDYKEAARWYRKAAELGFAPAQRLLGEMHFEGKGVPQSDTEGLKWLRMAAENGKAIAQHNLAIKYSKGEQVNKDLFEAGYWYRRAADQDIEGSKEYLRKAAALCDQDPNDNLIEENGCLIAAGAGYPDAQFIVGMLYDTGTYFKKDTTEALKWFRKAAEQGHIKSQVLLSKFYYEGKGTEKDLIESYAWLKVVAAGKPSNAEEELGIKSAKELMKIIYEQMPSARKREAEEKGEDYIKTYLE